MGRRSINQVERKLAEQRRLNQMDYAVCHPQRVLEERKLRKQKRQIRKNWSHKQNGTPETHFKASQTRQGALARLYESGAITIDQLAAAHEIASIAERIGRDVSVRSISLETRVDGGGNRNLAFESLTSVRREAAYGLWRQAILEPATIIDMIVFDIGITIAAQRHNIGYPRAKKLLISALNLWSEKIGEACRNIDADDVAAARSGLF